MKASLALEFAGRLESVDNILLVLERTEYNFGIWKMVMKNLKLQNKSEDELVEIIRKSKYNDLICEECLRYLKFQESIVEVLKNAYHSKNIAKAAATALKIKEMSQNELISIINSVNNNTYFLELCLPYLSSIDKIIDIIVSNSKNGDPVDEVVISALCFNGRSEREILDILLKANYDYSVCAAAVKSLGLKEMCDDDILDVMQKTKYNIHFCREAVYFLKSEEKIIYAIEKTDNEEQIKKIGTNLIKLDDKSEEELLAILRYHFYDCDINSRCIKHLHLAKKTTDELLNILEMSNYNLSVNIAVANEILFYKKNDEQILDILAKSGYNEYVSEKGITFLESEENILFVLAKTKFNSIVCRAGIPKLALGKKAKRRLLEIMLQTSYNENVSRGIIEKQNNPEEIILLMKQTQYNEAFCKVAIIAIDKLSNK